jgi:hypothetical protein
MIETTWPDQPSEEAAALLLVLEKTKLTTRKGKLMLRAEP